MIKITYDECKSIWDRKKIDNLIGQTEYCMYACKKLGVYLSKHNYIRNYYNQYKKENNG